MEQKKELATKLQIRIATALLMILILVFLFWTYFDFMKFKNCEEAIRLLVSDTPNYCQSWCLIYD